jgi:hypothetical protein
MKKITLTLIFHLAFIFILQGQVSFGDAHKINNNWKFQKGDIKEASSPSFDDSKWRQLNLPHDWSIEGPLSPDNASGTGFVPGGIAWYRKALDIPSEMKDKKVFIYFEGVYRDGEVFINGKSLGMRPNGFISYMYELTPYVNFGGKNTIAVRVDHSKNADSRFYTGSGIYRDVYLVYANSVHIDLWGVHYTTPTVNKKQAAVQIKTTVVNSTKSPVTLTVINQITDKNGKIVATNSQKVTVASEKTDTAKQQLNVLQPNLWSVSNPYLYKVTTSVFNGKTLVDKSTGNLGIRSLRFDADKGFFLNGVNMKVKGVCLHHDAGCLGAAVPREVWERRFKQLKSIGCNAIRTSHNPQAPVFYDLCDELGFLIMDEPFDEWEFPKNKWVEGWNIGIPSHQGSSEFFEEWAETDLRDMVLRDRNHPSVFMWSIGNEVDYPNDPYSHPILNQEGIQQQHAQGYLPDHPHADRLGLIAKRLVPVIKKYDTSRPTTGALAGPVMSNETDFPGTIDVVGYNYTERRYAQDHAKYPKRVFYGSENHQSFEAWKAVKDNDFIFGQFLWTGIEYLGESHRWPSRGFGSGLLNLAGNKKGLAYFRESLWSDSPMIYIGVLPRNRNFRGPFTDAPAVWNYSEGDTVRVFCYTNCESAQLKLNGEPASDVKKYDNSTGVIFWDIPYKPGKLEAIGYKSDKEMVRFAVETSKQPYTISAQAVDNVISADNGVAQILIQIVDEDGKPVYLADNEITCSLEGPVELLGMEAANNTDMTDYKDKKHRVYNGKMVVYTQATGVKGNAIVTFKSPWLKETKVNIEIK